MNKFIPFVVQNIYAILFSVVLFFISINIETNLKNTEYIEGKVTSIEPTTVESFRDKFLPLRKYYNVCIKNNAKNGCINVIEPNMGFEPIVHFLSEPNYFFAFWVKKEAFSDVFRIYKALVYEDEQKTKILKFYSGNDAEIVKFSQKELWLYKYSTLLLAFAFFWLVFKRQNYTDYANKLLFIMIALLILQLLSEIFF